MWKKDATYIWMQFNKRDYNFFNFFGNDIRKRIALGIVSEVS